MNVKEYKKIQALFSLLLKWFSLLQISLSYSFLNLQFTYMILIAELA